MKRDHVLKPAIRSEEVIAVEVAARGGTDEFAVDPLCAIEVDHVAFDPLQTRYGADQIRGQNTLQQRQLVRPKRDRLEAEGDGCHVMRARVNFGGLAGEEPRLFLWCHERKTVRQIDGDVAPLKAQGRRLKPGKTGEKKEDSQDED